MISRREFLTAAAAASALLADKSGFGLRQALAKEQLTQEHLLKASPVGQLTLLHITDIHAQLKPVYFREPSVNIGVGEVKGKPPHLTGRDFLAQFGIAGNSAEAYALTCEDFTALARNYGRMGGLDRIATIIKAVRDERGDGNVLLLDGGDTWQGSWTSLKTKGQDMIDLMALIKPEAMVGHWEFTYGTDRVKEASGRAALSVPRAECPRQGMAGAGVQGLGRVRARRREGRRDRPGLPLYPDRQSALDDPGLGVRHSRG